MKVTLFTSNNNRHNYLINLLFDICDELWVVQECKKLSTEKNANSYSKSKIFESYFNYVKEAENKIFRKEHVNKDSKKIKILPILFGEINNLSLSYLDNFLKSDIYVVFGSSYIKGSLIDLLISQKAINIHAGVSPYYRGTDCNFWALYDNRPHLVGATIHYLSKGLDSGDILYHALAKPRKNIFEYTMSSVKSAFYSLEERIKNESIFKIKSIKQDQSKELRYSRNIDFNEGNLKKFLSKKIILDEINFDENLLINPFFY